MSDSDEKFSRLEAELRRAQLRTNMLAGEDGADLLRLASLVQVLLEIVVEKNLADADEIERRVAESSVRLASERRSAVAPVRAQSEESGKYQQPNAEVDCEARFPLCHGACCAMEVPLSTEDVQEGVAEWDLSRPYYMRKGSDGRCVHQDRATCFCGIYQSRPKPCRAFSCQGDVRIWKDFDARIPNEKGIRALLEHSSSRRPMLIDLQATIPIRLKK